MDRNEVFLELSRDQQQSIQNRRSSEWKVNLAFWGGTGVITWFVTQHCSPINATLCWCLAFAYLVAWGIWIVGWGIPLHAAHEKNRLWKHFYAGLAAASQMPTDDTYKQDELRIKDQTKRSLSLWADLQHDWKMARPQSWFWGQLLITGLLFAFSLIIIIYSHDRVDDSTPKTDVLHISGKNLERAMDKLAK